MDAGAITPDAVCEALRSLRLPPVWDEYIIHAAVGDCLRQAGFACEHEVKIASGCRCDFFVDGHIVVEIKRGRPVRSMLLRQMARYLSISAVSAGIVLTERQTNLPETIGGKPCRVISLAACWGIAL